MSCDEIIQILQKPRKVWERIWVLQTNKILKELEESILAVTFPGVSKEQLNIQSSYDMDKIYRILKRLDIYKSNLYEELDQINQWHKSVSMVYHYFSTLPKINQQLIIEVYQKKKRTSQLKTIYRLSEKTILKRVGESIETIQKNLHFHLQNQDKKCK